MVDGDWSGGRANRDLIVCMLFLSQCHGSTASSLQDCMRWPSDTSGYIHSFSPSLKRRCSIGCVWHPSRASVIRQTPGSDTSNRLLHGLHDKTTPSCPVCPLLTGVTTFTTSPLTMDGQLRLNSLNSRSELAYLKCPSGIIYL